MVRVNISTEHLSPTFLHPTVLYIRPRTNNCIRLFELIDSLFKTMSTVKMRRNVFVYEEIDYV